MHVQNVRDFPQTKLDGEINSPFLLNEHGDPQISYQVFAKNCLIKNIFEEEKRFDSGTRFFFFFFFLGGGGGSSSQLGVFWPRRGLSEKVRYSGNQGIKNSLNNAYVALLSRYNSQPVKILYFKVNMEQLAFL